jgi:hypothetical protein
VELAGLRVADPERRWSALGFSVEAGTVGLGGVELELDAPGTGIVGWTLRHAAAASEIDGLATRVTSDSSPGAPPMHPNGAIGIDHVVVTTSDFDRTSAALDAAGLPLRRIRDAGSFRQGFRRLGPAILELVEVTGEAGPARFWGLVVICSDLEALRERLHPHRVEIKAAVQPERRIATLRDGAGLSTKLAFMNPAPAR